MKKKIGYGLLIIMIGIQFVRTSGDIIEYNQSYDFLIQTNAPDEIKAIIKTSCYDCHSNLTNTPWYGEIAPISWYINDHINEGQEELNFSAWGTYQLTKKKHKLEECWEEVEKGAMPLDGYLKLHSEAKLSEDNQKQLIAWFKSIKLR